MSYRSDLLIYIPKKYVDSLMKKFPYATRTDYLKEPGKESALIKFTYLPGSTVEDILNIIREYEYWEYITVGEDFAIEQESSNNDFYLEPMVSIRTQIPNCESKEIKMW